MTEKSLRERLNDSLREALKGRNQVEAATLRLILAALKDRDIAARAKGNHEGVGEHDILEMLRSMVRQRQESIALYERGGRLELAEQEANEIAVIERFLPEPLSRAETEQAVDDVLVEVRASSLKDMGRVMAMLRQAYPGRMDFAAASAIVKQRLG